MNALERYTSELNSNIFFREFSFSRNKFSPEPKRELEFADHVVWLDDLSLVFQCKERNISESNSANEIKWFNNNVVRDATKQIRNTLCYLRDYKEIHLTNDRNYIFNIATAKLKSIDKIVLYSAHKALPDNFRNKKHHNSSSVGKNWGQPLIHGQKDKRFLMRQKNVSPPSGHFCMKAVKFDELFHEYQDYLEKIDYGVSCKYSL